VHPPEVAAPQHNPAPKQRASGCRRKAARAATPEPEPPTRRDDAQRSDDVAAAPPSAGDDDEGSEADEARELARAAREAAALCANPRARAAALPHGLPPSKLASAAGYLNSNTGMAAGEAGECLLAAAEHWRDWDRWMDEAMMWVANRNEDAEEAAKLRHAMSVSLAERERAATEEEQKPLVNLSEARLRDRFVGSVVLEKVRG
jgi:hypothetical protein